MRSVGTLLFKNKLYRKLFFNIWQISFTSCSLPQHGWGSTKVYASWNVNAEKVKDADENTVPEQKGSVSLLVTYLEMQIWACCRELSDHFRVCGWFLVFFSLALLPARNFSTPCFLGSQQKSLVFIFTSNLYCSFLNNHILVHTRDPKRKRSEWRRIWGFLKYKRQGEKRIHIACRDHESKLCFTISQCMWCVESVCLERRMTENRDDVFGVNLWNVKGKKDLWRRGQKN